jgi:hypothetical protein
MPEKAGLVIGYITFELVMVISPPQSNQNASRDQDGQIRKGLMRLKSKYENRTMNEARQNIRVGMSDFV